MLKRWSAVLVLLVISACHQPPQTLTVEGQTMGTTYRIVVVDAHDNYDEPSLRAVIDDVFVQVNTTFSNWDPGSEISLINANQTGLAMSVSDDLMGLLKTADDVHVKSDGKFDITLGPLIELWGFGAFGPDAALPADEAIIEALSKVGQRTHIVRDERAGTVRKSHPEVSLYIAALAKGQGIDSVVDRLSGMGFDNFMVEIGGDLFAVGKGPTGKGWRIGIEEPTAGSQKVERIIAINGLGMATSGDYRNYFEEDGVRYSHIIDPGTGRPVLHTTASVTVLAENAALADAWATALLVLGSERGLQIAEEEGLAAFFIDRSAPGSEEPFINAETPSFGALLARPLD